MPSVSLSTTANPSAIPGNSKRVALTVFNSDNTNIAYLRAVSYSTATVTSANAEYQIGPGGSIAFQIPLHGQKITQSQFQGIAGAGTPTLIWGETVP